MIRKGPRHGTTTDGDAGPAADEPVAAGGEATDAPSREADDATSPEATEEAPPGELAELPEADVLLEELARGRGEIESLKDRHLRLAAEYDNFRKRTARERGDLRTLAQVEVVRSVVPTLDDLARWRDIPNEATTVEALDKGLDLVLRNLEKALAEHGVERVAAEGARFDPELHQALMTGEAARPEDDDTVGRVFSHGYTIRGQLVRPAQVEVLRWHGPAAGDTGEALEDENGGAGPEDVEA
ncbi:MAG: nucleotide exchange factor GrpE [Gemmatimonadota bacterium]